MDAVISEVSGDDGTDGIEETHATDRTFLKL